MTGASDVRHLANLLAGLERNFMDASDREILASEDSAAVEKQTRRLVSSLLNEHESAIEIPKDPTSRRQLFDLIIRSKSPAALRMSYGPSQKMSDEEISGLLMKLLRRGRGSGRKK